MMQTNTVSTRAPMIAAERDPDIAGVKLGGARTHH